MKLPPPEAPNPDKPLPPTSPIPYSPPVVLYPWPGGPVITIDSPLGIIVIRLGGGEIIIDISKFRL